MTSSHEDNQIISLTHQQRVRILPLPPPPINLLSSSTFITVWPHFLMSYLKALDHLGSISSPISTLGTFLSRQPTISIPVKQNNKEVRGETCAKSQNCINPLHSCRFQCMQSSMSKQQGGILPSSGGSLILATNAPPSRHSTTSMISAKKLPPGSASLPVTAQSTPQMMNVARTKLITCASLPWGGHMKV